MERCAGAWAPLALVCANAARTRALLPASSAVLRRVHVVPRFSRTRLAPSRSLPLRGPPRSCLAPPWCCLRRVCSWGAACGAWARLPFWRCGLRRACRSVVSTSAWRRHGAVCLGVLSVGAACGARPPRPSFGPRRRGVRNRSAVLRNRVWRQRGAGCLGVCSEGAPGLRPRHASAAECSLVHSKLTQTGVGGVKRPVPIRGTSKPTLRADPFYCLLPFPVLYLGLRRFAHHDDRAAREHFDSLLDDGV